MTNFLNLAKRMLDKSYGKLKLRAAGICFLASFLWLATIDASDAQFRSSYARDGLGNTNTGHRSTGQPLRYGGATVYPEFKSSYGTIRWLNEQMPLKVYVSHGLSLEGFIDEELGAPVVNVDNLNKWPDLLADVATSPEAMQGLPQAPGFTEAHYQAVIQGISMWKPFEKEGLFSYVLVTDPAEADIHVFFVHHFVNKMGLALFSGDIRGYTAKRSFPYKAIIAGGKAEFKPVLIMLRTTEANGTSLPFQKMRAAAAHEMGHALGIEGHSTNPIDIMSIYYGNGIISANDAATIRYLYHLVPDLIP